MRIVIALGGNALLERGEKPDAAIQRRHVGRAARSLALLATDHQLIVCHGNGPQVGLLAHQSETDPQLSLPYPLDVLGAQTQGMIGYWLVQELANAGVPRPVVALVNQTVVDADDPAFAAPTKFIGAGYSQEQAEEAATRYGWTMAVDGDRWRQVVPSPEPLRVVEEETIRTLVDRDVVVVCGGGGGAPVTEDRIGRLTGVAAVVDKDMTAAQLALALGADRLLVLTDVPAIMRGYGTPRAEPIRAIDAGRLAEMPFPDGSMGPKVDACVWFAQTSGHPAAVGALADAVEVLAGHAGTTITPGLPTLVTHRQRQE
ncbi:carbamate kinase [Actinoplanes sp. ATCC 53533]|uniref:carbamate kinase n=1 Tax=Actinoplanes sp. ATCC 53533 TaxID=1288362 RepID=UPI000F7A4F0B|nr:carbamate kinase [Actinoplanes sp. ATCC 53533]RSM53349.1 carbamate kinase [Actinoplanes sp. ATCC 53533]